MAKPQKKSPHGYKPIDMSKYEELDTEWRKIGLSAPARRALVEAKLYKVSDLRKITLDQLVSLPQMGSSSVARIRQIMEAKKIKFLG